MTPLIWDIIFRVLPKDHFLYLFACSRNYRIITHQRKPTVRIITTFSAGPLRKVSIHPPEVSLHLPTWTTTPQCIKTLLPKFESLSWRWHSWEMPFSVKAHLLAYLQMLVLLLGCWTFRIRQEFLRITKCKNTQQMIDVSTPMGLALHLTRLTF